MLSDPGCLDKNIPIPLYYQLKELGSDPDREGDQRIFSDKPDDSAAGNY